LLPKRLKTSKNTGQLKKGGIDRQKLIPLLFKEPIQNSSKRWCGKNNLSVLAYEIILTQYKGNLRIINMVRDGRDVVTEAHKNVSGHFSVSSEQWVHDVESGIKTENHPQILTIRYEDLIKDYENTIKKVSIFIGENDFSLFLKYPKGATIIEDKLWIGRSKQPQYSKKAENLLKTKGALECQRHYNYLENEADIIN
jgi:hypothetical protein